MVLQEIFQVFMERRQDLSQCHPWLLVEMGSLGVSSAIKARWDSGCV